MRTPRVILAVTVALVLAGCGGGHEGDWSNEQLQKDGAAAVKRDLGKDGTLQCEGGLTNRQGSSIRCKGSDGMAYIIDVKSEGELRASGGTQPF
ncbi:hypothetical protein OOK41_13850 [Micromonospora sp. NBC_01655]|uniref:hypothetical protein n=1 Tax=Micromonospora sp. NBC_01655 TaxID=2975983 RepID=UPI00224F4AB3|nr:hypothetical protein [Micromonospora sp. NBC_01655]MCX4471379.1 hypothetical protein [Micromonospora sp. NBC_01655]